MGIWKKYNYPAINTTLRIDGISKLDNVKLTHYKCRICGIIKPLTQEFFFRQQGTFTGFKYYCKSCCSKLNRLAYYRRKRLREREKERKLDLERKNSNSYFAKQ